MLHDMNGIICGYFDSRIHRGKDLSDSSSRTVKHPELELYTEETSGLTVIDNVAYERKRGMVIVAKKGQVRREGDWRCYFVRFREPDDTDLALINALPTVLYLDNVAYEKTYDIYRRMIDTYVERQDSDTALLRMNSLLYNLLYCFAKSAEGDDGTGLADTPANTTLIAIKNYIEHNCQSQCSLKELGEIFHISPNYMQKLFKEQFGKSPHEYRESVLIRRARRMIAEGNYSLLEISIELGFSSQSHFNRVFKANVGMTPAVYRRKILESY